MSQSQIGRPAPRVDVETLRHAVSKEYAEVAHHPTKGFHFHTGRPLASLLGYEESWLADVPESSIESFAGTGNPFRLGEIPVGAHVVDVGCGAGMASLIAAKMVGRSGRVIGVDMTQAMLKKARTAASKAGMDSVEFRRGYAEELPVEDGWADVVIANGVLNLVPDKSAALGEFARVLNRGGRLQIGDILVERPVPEEAKADIDLWTG